MEKWKFVDLPNTMVITTKNIMHNKFDILFVTHDADDGMWQFLDATEINENNAAVVGLEDIVGIDPSVNELHDLPLGWEALRNNKNDEWKIRKSECT
mgnify:CR=1 FL=1